MSTSVRPKVLDFWPDLSRWTAEGYLRVDRKGDLVLIGYTDRCQYARAWDGVTNECRGIVFRESTREVVAWPFAKFFNLGEAAETKIEALPKEPFEVTEKIDGALGIMYRDEDGELSITTRGSFRSEEGLWATQYLRAWLARDEKLAKAFVPEDFTYLFEICAPLHGFFHVAMKAPGLYLIGMRDLQTGREIAPSGVRHSAQMFGVPFAEPFPSDLDLLQRKAEEIKATECEGWVLHFESGLKVKVKGADYVRLARFLQSLSARHAFECVRDGRTEIPEGVPPKYADRFRDLVASTRRAFDVASEEAEAAYQFAGAIGTDCSREERKEFAQKVHAFGWSDLGMPGLAFDRIKGPLVPERVWEALRRAEVWKRFELPEDEAMKHAAEV